MSRSAHPAGPRHADVLPEAHAGPAPADLHALDPAIWPTSAARVDGVVRVGGVTVTELVAEYGTPALFLDEDDLRARARAYAQAFDGMDVYYAGKAFLCTDGRAVARGRGPGAGRLHRRRTRGRARRRVPRGADLAARQQQVARRAPARGRRRSRSRHRRLLRRDRAVCPPSRRTGSGCSSASPSASRRTRTSSSRPRTRTRSSASRCATAPRPRRSPPCSAPPNLDLVGLHSHIGSQIFDTAGFEVAAHRVVALARGGPRRATASSCDELDLGGGLGIAYVDGDDPRDAAADASTGCVAIVERECASAGLRRAAAVGRAGPCDRRPERDHRLRGRHGQAGEPGRRSGAHVRLGRRRHERQHPHGALRRRVHLRARHRGVRRPRRCCARVVGKHCESGDIVVRDVWLPGDVAPGDLLAVAATGAYCRSMASNYNHVPRPPVVGVRDGDARVLVRRETEDDLLRLDWSPEVTGRDDPTRCTDRAARLRRRRHARSCGCCTSRPTTSPRASARRSNSPAIAVRRPDPARATCPPTCSPPTRRRWSPATTSTSSSRSSAASSRRARCCSPRCSSGKSVVTANKALLAERRRDAARRGRRRRRRPLLRGGGRRRDPAAAPAARVAGRRPHHAA